MATPEILCSVQSYPLWVQLLAFLVIAPIAWFAIRGVSLLFDRIGTWFNARH